MRTAFFNSFWQAGFESANHINRAGVRLDMVESTGHDRHLVQDYARLPTMGIRVVREGIRWHLVDKGVAFDFSSLRPMIAVAAEHQIQVLWTLCHYGTPDGVDLFSPGFVERFARYAGAVARFVRDTGNDIPCYTPINEISFLAWGAGDVGCIHPFGIRRGTELKRNLVRAAIAAMEAIWQEEPRARFLHCDPVINVVAPHGRPDLARAAADMTESQYEAWDMLAGGYHADLGGHPRYLDIIGANYYHSNQWEFPHGRMSWDEDGPDPRRIPFHQVLDRLYHRYERPVTVSETSHVGVGRARWLREIAQEVRLARWKGVPVEGICIYPIIDRPDWDNLDHWHNSGLWDLEHGSGRLERRVCAEYAAELAEVQQMLADERLTDIRHLRAG